MRTFSLDRRDSELERMSKETFDIVVVGGGITGAGVLLDASARGLKAALVEKGDFASGTSSRSSRLIHGGLRYLGQRELGLVNEALTERRNLQRMAPHAVRPVPFVLPILHDSAFASMKGALRAGLWAYDAAGGIRAGRRHEHVSASEASQLAPFLSAGSMSDAFVYWDSVNDDARMALSLVRTSVCRYGAAAANYCEAIEIDPSTFRTGNIVVRCQDRGATGEFEIRAKCAVVAAGVWTDQINVGKDPGNARIRPAKGIHVMIPQSLLPASAATLLPVPDDERFIFAIPWGRYTLVGTTDTDYSGSLDEARADPVDIHYLLDALNAWSEAGLTTGSISSSFAGLRPLAAGAKTERTADMSRREVLDPVASGILAVYGGKYTTWRSMAASAVDYAARHADMGAIPKSVTSSIQIDGSAPLDASTTMPPNLPPEYLDRSQWEHLVTRYGSHARAVIAISADLGAPLQIHEDLPYLRAETIFAARYEMAVTLDDIMTRRLRASTDNISAARACAPRVADDARAEMHWSPSDIELNLTQYQGASAQFEVTIQEAGASPSE